MTHEVAKLRLEQTRARIDGIDVRIVALLNRRADLMKSVRLAKKILRLQLKDGEREREVIAKVKNHAVRPLTKKAVTRIYRLIMEVMRELQAGNSQRQGPRRKS